MKTVFAKGTVAVTIPSTIAPVHLEMRINGVQTKEYAKILMLPVSGGWVEAHIYGEGLELLAGQTVIADLVIVKPDAGGNCLIDLMSPKIRYNFHKPTHKASLVRKGTALNGHFRFDLNPVFQIDIAPAPAAKAQISKLETVVAQLHATTKEGDQPRGGWRYINARGQVVSASTAPIAQLAHA